MNSDDEHREPTTEEVLGFCRNWAADVTRKWASSAVEIIDRELNKTAKMVRAARKARQLSPADIDVSKCSEGFNPWEPHSIRKPAWIDARQRRPPIPERRPLAVRKWQSRQAAKRKAGNVNRRRARRSNRGRK
jgi:hypothetical protein